MIIWNDKYSGEPQKENPEEHKKNLAYNKTYMSGRQFKEHVQNCDICKVDNEWVKQTIEAINNL